MIINSFGESGFEDDWELSLNRFDSIVSKFNLKPDFFLTIEDNNIIVNETWSSELNDVYANRVYEFNLFFLELIPEDILKGVLEEALSIYVNNEQYEEAADVRDSIKILYG